MPLRDVFKSEKKQATPENLAMLISAYILNDIVVSPCEPLLYLNSDIKNFKSDRVGRADLIKNEIN